ncbi:hypothetical protein RSJ21_14490 [Clostridium botulinum]|jgi:hypothetical protein|nr:hypothetical protein CLB_2700 [Clostridium botulinum A str. ATCC 19397]ABS38301.1 hypothetical protein CLC_2633 [Clostridium botulinum A str. Hall]ABS42907.1 hypothetical protein CLI_2809 [Clostridium botulinum F str. Langeland]ACA44135.1 hypothetical protein CLD_1815 [Clostridium botulinum B1 str. Okra]ACA57127.1 hypothetical protein CLK_2144 [Clostridium botulinum A3 str. Loch Maree]ACQ54619.1 hypothetical protein CLJ_B2986 [Clostridium botulinum Ba4 str. 657]ADG00428.1 hypothetical prot
MKVMGRKMKKRRVEKTVNNMLDNVEKGFKKIAKEMNKK